MTNHKNYNWIYNVAPADSYTEEEIIDMFIRADLSDDDEIHDMLQDRLWPLADKKRKNEKGSTIPYRKRMEYSIIPTGNRKKQAKKLVDIQQMYNI